MAVSLATMLIAGCGGDDGPAAQPQPPSGTGTVRGEVKYLDYPDLEATGIVVRVGDTETTTENGKFEAHVRPGTYTVVVEPPEGFALPPGAPPTVTVAREGEVVTLTEPFVLVTEEDYPPSPPS